ncbi:hypothetical protein ONZ45_g7962 [Pleurotus djamor]|nr:hypothetical protein ONZ45_g7962 [Pleurotus djamor]
MTGADRASMGNVLTTSLARLDNRGPYTSYSGSALTDITPAAGWVILDCDPHALQQEVRLVCSTPDLESAGCQHVFDNGGPVDRVVRLPESCSAAPFLRVASARVADDQSVPAEFMNTVARRDASAPIVHLFSLDANWAAVDVSKNGPVNLTFSASSFPDSDPEVQARDTEFEMPSWIAHPIDTAKSALTTVTEYLPSVPSVLKSAADGFKTTVGGIVPSLIEPGKTQHAPSLYDTVTTKVGGAIGTVANQIQQGTSYSYHPDIKEEVHFNQEENVVIYSYQPSGQGRLYYPRFFDPPQGEFKMIMTEHSVHGIINADADLHINVNASLGGHIESARKKIAHIPLTPYQIPGIIAAGPIVNLETQVGFDPQLSVAFETHVRAHVRELEFWYPIQHRGVVAKAVDFKPLEFDLSAGPNISARADFTGHLIPSLELGVTILSGSIEFVAVGEADVYVKAAVSGEAFFGNQRRSPRRIDPAQLETRAADVQFRGCLELDVGLVLRGGLKADALGYDIATRSWDLYEFPSLSFYHQCWTGSNFRKRSQNSQSDLYKDIKVDELPFLNCVSKSKQPKRVGKADKFERDFYPLVPPNP